MKNHNKLSEAEYDELEKQWLIPKNILKRKAVLLAINGACGVKVWCKYCKEFHHHSDYGPKEAHCRKETPYKEHGYILIKMYGED